MFKICLFVLQLWLVSIFFHTLVHHQLCFTHREVHGMFDISHKLTIYTILLIMATVTLLG